MDPNRRRLLFGFWVTFAGLILAFLVAGLIPIPEPPPCNTGLCDASSASALAGLGLIIVGMAYLGAAIYRAAAPETSGIHPVPARPVLILVPAHLRRATVLPASDLLRTPLDPTMPRVRGERNLPVRLLSPLRPDAFAVGIGGRGEGLLDPPLPPANSDGDEVGPPGCRPRRDGLRSAGPVRRPTRFRSPPRSCSTVQGEFLRFSKAVAPASWTIPSHASLFTGRYPWDHGAHYKGGGVLGPALPTIAEYLRDRGYRTTCLSANGYVQPGTGLTRGFEQLRWGGDREFFLRFLAQEPSCPSLNGADAAVHARLERDSSASPLRVGTMRALSRFTPFCDALNRVGGKVKGASPAYVGPWIEREFDRALVDAERQPVFTFVNLLEAHEPYLANAGRPIGARDWLAYARTTQVSEQWTRGEAEPTANDLAWSKRDYLASMQVIDERVGHLVRLLRSHDRWDRTLFVLTSDHGQTFGEGGRMYHRLNLQEEITRIPLWVKFGGAEGRSPGTDDRSWVSLVDLPTTIARSVEPSGAFGDPESVPLQAADRAPNRTVYSLTDGVGPSEGESLPAARRETLDRVQIAGYRGSFKSIVDQSGTEYHFRLTRSGATLVAPDDREFDAAAFADIGPKLRTVLDQRTPTSVSQRIAGWGY